MLGNLLPSSSRKQESLLRFVPTARSVFQEMDASSVCTNEDFLLPVLASIDRMIELVSVRTSGTELESGMYRLSVPEYDKRAVREAIVNAYAHRDYALMGRIRVALH